MKEKKPVVRNAFDRQRVSLETKGPSRVDQSQRDLVDINKIVARAQKTGHWPYNPNRGEAFYADASQVTDLLESFEIVQRAEAAFAALPAEVRRAMDNDPRNLESWLADPANIETAAQHGLVNLPPEAPEEPAKAPQEPAKPATRTASSGAPKGSAGKESSE